MGGEGSGRKPDVTNKILKESAEKRIPIATAGDSMYLPNYSGLKPEVLKTNSTALSPWNTSGSNIYYDAGNVGINTASPDLPLVVENSGATGYSDSGIKLSEQGGANSWQLMPYGNDLYFGRNGSTQARLTSAGQWIAGSLVLLDNATLPHTIDDTEMRYLDGLNQSLATTNSPQFANLVITSGGDIKPSSNAVNAINMAQADGTNFINFDTTNKALYLGGSTSKPDSNAKLYVVDTANMTLRGATQETGTMILGSKAESGSSYVNKLMHMDNNKGNARSEFTLSNSGDSTTDATGNAIWQNNFVAMMVNGARFSSNYYLTNITGKTSDAGYAYILGQGGYNYALGVSTYNDAPLYLGSANRALVRLYYNGSESSLFFNTMSDDSSGCVSQFGEGVSIGAELKVGTDATITNLTTTSDLIVTNNSFVENHSSQGDGSGTTIFRELSGNKDLSDNTTTSIAEIGLSEGEMVGGQIYYTFYVDDGTDLQCHTGSSTFAVVYKSGDVMYSDIDEVYIAAQRTFATSAGTMTDTWTITHDEANSKFIIKALANTSLDVGINLKYTIKIHSDKDITRL